MTLYSMCLFSLVPFIFILLSHFFKKNIELNGGIRVFLRYSSKDLNKERV